MCIYYLNFITILFFIHFIYYNYRSVIALAGDNFCVIAADTRLSTGFSIYTREQQKLFPLSSKTVLGCSGCWCDTLTLTRILSARMQVKIFQNILDDRIY